MSKYPKLKDELKELAQTIKENKINLKVEQRAGKTWDASARMSGLTQTRSEFRHKHLAYCLLRGTPYKAIESKISFQNAPNVHNVLSYMRQYGSDLDEAKMDAIKEDITNAIKEAYRAEALCSNAR